MSLMNIPKMTLATGLPALSLAVVSMLGACTVQERVVYRPAPPPPPRYVPPPPPPAEYVEADGEMQASEPPPPLPDYEQPPCPEDGYLWTPGYWRWGGSDYFWVPGTWVSPPRVGVLWTPGYWGFVGAVYVFHAGYWGPHVGFYGGVNYGGGYIGAGFAGGRWDGGHFAYNQSVTNVNTTIIHNTYNTTVVNNVTVNRVSYNGGAAGVRATATPQEMAVSREQHVPPTSMQREHVQEAARNPQLAARANGGNPAIAATARPNAFSGPGVVGARGAAPRVGGGNPAPQSIAGQAQHAAANPALQGGGQPAQGRPNNSGQPGQPGRPAGATNAPAPAARPQGGNPNAARPQPPKAQARPQPPKKPPAERPRDEHNR